MSGMAIAGVTPDISAANIGAARSGFGQVPGAVLAAVTHLPTFSDTLSSQVAALDPDVDAGLDTPAVSPDSSVAVQVGYLESLTWQLAARPAA